MEEREKPNMDRYNKLTNNWNYDASLIFVAMNVLITINQFKTFPLLL
jgi:hypothetical protein